MSERDDRLEEVSGLFLGLPEADQARIKSMAEVDFEPVRALMSSEAYLSALKYRLYAITLNERGKGERNGA